MNNIKLIIDESMDIPADLAKELDITVVNLNVTFGDEQTKRYTNQEFYEKMRSFPILPKTSCPSPESFMDAYAGEEDVLVITLSSVLSATYATAVLSRDMYLAENKMKDIRIIDSENGSIGALIICIKAKEMIDSGMCISEIESQLKFMTEYHIHYGSLETIENAVKGGRISKTKGFVVNALNLKPIVKVQKEVTVVDKGRGTKQSIKKMVDLVERDMGENPGKTYSILGIGHSNDPEKAELLKEMMLEKYSFEKVVVAEIGPIIGTYTSEGAVLISVI